MFSQLIRYASLSGAILLFAAGCASTQTILPPAAPAVSAPTMAPTAASNAPAPATVPASSASSGGNIVRLVVVPQKSEARYRVREQLVGVNLPSDAIGRTQEITGTIVGKTDGTIVSSESKFVVDLSTLQSDRSQRDNFLRRNVLQTDQYPNATFVPTQAPGLPTTVPASGEATFKLIGDLTVRNVIKQVTWDVTCKAQGDQGTCQASTTFQFEFFDLTPPRVPVVLSVEDNIRLEVDLVLQRVSA
jgi:polyisoprenoid-binding protein YceI